MKSSNSFFGVHATGGSHLRVSAHLWHSDCVLRSRHQMQQMRHEVLAAVCVCALDIGRKEEECAYGGEEGNRMYGLEEAEVQSSFGALEVLSWKWPVLMSAIQGETFYKFCLKKQVCTEQCLLA